VVERAKAAWENVGLNRALEIIDEGIRNHPGGLALHKLRGDILAASRHPQDAVRSYETVLAGNPAALDVRWAKWSVLVRAGEEAESIAELQHIARVDAGNPLVHLRLAQELRKLDRIEEALESYKKAVALAPELLNWRLGLARVRFDVLDYQGAYDDVQYVLQKMPPSSPLEIPANELLSTILKPTTDRGRRAKTIFSPDVTAEQLKEWSFVRSDAWNLFTAGKYQEAEPAYRRALALNPHDYTAAHQLGVILMELNRCEEALTVFETMAKLDPKDEDYADSVFRAGQCLAKLERWSEAYLYFQVLYDAAVEFEEGTKHLRLPSGTRVLSKEKIVRWLDKVRPHVPESERVPFGGAPVPDGPSEEEVYAKIAARPLKPQKPLEARASLMGRDSDFSWFRFVIPAGRIMRDDDPTGDHEFIPLAPGDSFHATQPAIYLVFGLLTASYDAVPLTAQCFLETSEMAGEPRAVAQDQVVMSMNDQSGYFKLTPPKTGWTPGLYRCGLFMGERTSAYTQADEVRFRIVDPARSS
jgi:tetratricopeptide (TPR) repeat protein